MNGKAIGTFFTARNWLSHLFYICGVKMNHLFKLLQWHRCMYILLMALKSACKTVLKCEAAIWLFQLLVGTPPRDAHEKTIFFTLLLFIRNTSEKRRRDVKKSNKRKRKKKSMS